jgi:fumarylacetoacetase
MAANEALTLIDETHDPARRSWVASAYSHPDFPIQNLPLGIFAPDAKPPRGGIAIGNEILDLARLAESGLLQGEALRGAVAASGSTLNPLLALGAEPRRALRRAVSALLSDPGARDRVTPMLHPAGGVSLHLPATVGDYTDFYVGIHHATNVGKLFRPDNPLLPNYKHVPIGYHGRASSVAVSGCPVRRPSGQTFVPGAQGPSFMPTQRLDYELELGVWIGPGNCAGEPIAIGEADGAIAGICLLNDWSARDIQAWEYQPLGPFLSKNFLTTVSPWIVTAEALAPFRAPQPPRDPADPLPLPYLWDDADQAGGALAARLEVALRTPRMRARGEEAVRLASVSTSNMYWTIAQLVAHHSAGGCNLRPGDLFGTGTISGAEPAECGSLLELTSGGLVPVELPGGEQRSFLHDGDEIIISGCLEAPGYVSIGLGECRSTVAAD